MAKIIAVVVIIKKIRKPFVKCKTEIFTVIKQTFTHDFDEIRFIITLKFHAYVTKYV